MKFALLALALLAIPPGDDGLTGLTRAFKTSRRPADAQERRTAALAALGERHGEDVVVALVTAARSLSREIERIEDERVEYLAVDKRDRKLEDRKELDPLKGLADAIAERLRAMDDPESAAAQVRAALTTKRLPTTLRVAMASRASEAGPGILASITEILNRPRDADELLPALIAARALGAEAAPLEQPLIARLRDGSATVREAAAAALAAAGSAGAIEPLIAGVERERGRTRTRFGRALEILTGARLGANPEAWRRWLADHGTRVDTAAPADAKPTEDDRADYYGILIDGDSVVFVLDRSKSMNQSLAKKTEEGEKNPKAKTAPPGERRIDRARTELKRSIEMLRPDQTFNIVAFGSTCLLFEPKPVAARPRTITKALAWVDSIPLEWGTNLYDAMQRTFLMAGRGAADDVYDSSIDTIFVLTDGQPVIKSKYDNKNRLRAEVQRFNLLGRVVIHTIGLGEPLPKKFLSALAEENGGRFVHEKAAE